MNSPVASAVFALPHYDVHGRIAAANSRALDVVNDSSTRFLKLEHVRVCTPGDAEALLKLESTVVVKSSLQAVLLLNEDRTNESKVYFASLARKTLEVVVTLPTMMVRGRIHTKSGDLQTFLSLEAGTFFPVTGATVHRHEREKLTLECTVVLVNKDRVSTISPIAT